MAKRIQPHLLLGVGDVAEYALLPGDPRRAERIASLLDGARKVAEYRGFVAYTGTHAGIPVSAVSTGIGCPSACIVVEELSRVGVKTFIRVGTTGSIQEHIDAGDIVIATAATRTDGSTKAYVPVEYPAVASHDVVNALVRAAEKLGVKHHLGIVWTSDAFYAETADLVRLWGKAGVLSVEMECSALFTLASLKGLRAGAILAVDGNLVKGRKKGEFEPGEKGGELADEVRRAVDAEIRVALEAIALLEATKERYESAGQ